MSAPERRETTSAALGRPAGEGGLLIERGGLVVYIDPNGACEGLPKADIVCVSAVDPRRAPETGVRAVSMPTTIIAGLPQCVSRFRLNQLPLLHGQSRTALGLELFLSGDDGTTVRWRLRWSDLDVMHPI
ncbi:MAG TPA: hypothetical protein DCZ01_12580 [Elusimicrobia bacterium]|nr:MAG: hypothetical protein A2X37_04825 [Elusimicrobia bacterium GWA2_66_18]OGR71926.1 MAG: hypothetical protein A2X40_01600 [Elusimicrobia bacterium GWC2_65_9]HAZ09323.1 hypothetical protein [Elusimicrobiota bacterium]